MVRQRLRPVWGCGVSVSVVTLVAATALGDAGDYTRSIGGQPYVFKDWTYYDARSNNGNWDVRGRLYVPPNLDPNVSHPLVVFIHGRDESGSETTPTNNNTSQVNGNINNLIVNAKNRGFLVYAPQTPYTYVSDDITQFMQGQVAKAMRQYNVDPQRVYVTGLSQGGGGVHQVLNDYSSLYAAYVPLSPAGYVENAALAATKPVWYYHGRQDTLIGPGVSRASVNAILQARGLASLSFPSTSDKTNNFYYANGNLRYTEYANSGHDNSVWNNGAYNDAGMYNWLLSKSSDVTTLGRGKSIAVSFGPSTTNELAADASGKRWNQLGRYGTERSTEVAVGFANDTTGSETTVAVTIVQPFDNVGTAVPSGITAFSDPTIASRYWRTLANTSAQIVFENLEPGHDYDLKLFASTTNANYRSLFSADGETATLLATNNLNQFALLSSLTATADGTLTLTISPTGGATYAALNAFELTSAVPEPTTTAIIASAGMLLIKRRRRIR